MSRQTPAPTRNNFICYWGPVALATMMASSFTDWAHGDTSWTLKSPSSRLAVRIEYDSQLRYAVSLRGEHVIKPSTINLNIAGVGRLVQPGQKLEAAQQSVHETIDFVVPRKFRKLDMAYNELKLTLPSGGAVAFRAYDEGVAYRWETSLPDTIEVDDERAEFLFPGKPHTWFPEEENIFTHQERVYKHIALAEVGPDRFCSTGVLIDLSENRKIYISESDLQAYPGMFLRGAGGDGVGLVGKFAPYALATEARNDRDIPVSKAANFLAKTKGTRTFPWRLMLVTENDAELLTSELVFALAPPLAIEDPSWIQPGKAAWEWWNSINVTGVDFRAGVNTATYKYYIDFAADYGLKYVLLDEGWSADPRDVLSANPDVDLEELARYGKAKGVRLLLWVVWKSLDDKLEAALDKFEKLGVAGIKVDFMQRDDQWMVEFYHRVAREAAKRQLLVDFHGAFKPTGLGRAYPNVMTYEAMNGLEQYKWGNEKTNPEQELVYPFIRMVAGPLDFTPGALTNSDRESWRWNVGHPMSLGTRCRQLAMYVVYESPLQMLADSPARYRREIDTMRFLSAVPTTWDTTVPLAAKVSDYVAIARRNGEDWFIGAMTDWDSREMTIKLDFLPPGEFKLETWSDGINADRNGEDMHCDTRTVRSHDEMTIKMAPAGGWAARLQPIQTTSIQNSESSPPDN